MKVVSRSYYLYLWVDNNCTTDIVEHPGGEGDVDRDRYSAWLYHHDGELVGIFAGHCTCVLLEREEGKEGKLLKIKQLLDIQTCHLAVSE